MMKKQITESNLFRPFPFAIEKTRKGTLNIKSPPIDWACLDEDQMRVQQAHCYNVLWQLEKEGIISRQHLEPYFYNCLEKSGYSKDDIRNIRKLKDWQISFTLLKIPFMLSLGMRSKDSVKYLMGQVNDLIEEGKKIAETEKETKAAVPRKTIQEAMAEQLSNILGELQGIEDDTLLGDKPDFMNWFRNRNMAKAHVDDIEVYFKPRLAELNAINTDDQIKEAYSCYTKKQIKAMIAWYESLLNDLDAYKRVKQSQRKVRARKPKSPLRLVAKLKYMRNNDEYKISSVKPESIIGCDTLWVFNTKTRKLCVYIASEMDKELTVKGTTILGWDPKTSIGKTLRKPQEQLTEFMNGGKVHMRNFLKGIKGKEAKLNGRINKDILLVKVY